MGLAERQAMAQLKETGVPEVSKKVNDVVGKPIEVVIDEATFTTTNAINYFISYFKDRFADDLKVICADKLGKEAVQETIKTIKVVHTANEKSFTMDLTNGIFTIVGKWDGSLGTDCPAYGDYKKFLLTKL
jgi:hypothetical protein